MTRLVNSQQGAVYRTNERLKQQGANICTKQVRELKWQILFQYLEFL
jgi:hypothetical protein